MDQEKLVRGLGKWDLTAIVINSIIGAGIFGLPSKIAALIGSYSIFAFLLCALIISVIVLCFAEVASRFTATGGMYLYAREAFGPLIGFEIGWLAWVVRVATFAANCNLLLSYIGFFYPPATQGAVRIALILTVVGGLTAVNFLGVRESALLTNIFTVGKLMPLLLFAALGLFFIQPSNFQFDELPGYTSFSGAVLLALYAFVGFENAVVPAGEIRDPQKNVPLALFMAVGVVFALYILIQSVSIGVLPGIAASERPLADASVIFLGRFGATLITLGAIVSILGNLNSGFLTGSRMPYAIAQQWELPSVIGRAHHRFRTPHISILITGAVILILTVQSSFLTALTISTITRLFVYAATCAALPVFRRRNDMPDAKFKAPAGVLASIISLLLIVWLLTTVDYQKEGLAVIITGFVGLAIYLVYLFVRKDRGGRYGRG